jgi:hypothetical protein
LATTSFWSALAVLPPFFDDSATQMLALALDSMAVTS